MDSRGDRAICGEVALANAGFGEHPWPCDLVDRLSMQAHLRAEHIAVEGPEGKLTYGELDALVRRMACCLRRRGVQAHARVGVSLPRGLGELVVMLAIAKAGASYVPLDPTQPIARLRVILEDAKPQLVVVAPSSPLLGEGTEKLLVMESLAAVLRGESDAPLSLAYAPHDVAYILFTSGSTGRPKGVEVTRGAFANFLQSMAHTPGLQPHDRVVAITTTSFDIAGLELFLPLWVGATVVIANRDTAHDARLLRRFLEQDTFTVMQATPATWRLLLETGWRPSPALRKFCGGEALYPELAARLLAGGGELWNLYGPTETTVWSTVRRLAEGGPITIGQPIDGTQIYIFDEHLQPVLDGLEGEICIGGRGLARGYFGRPDLTAERFVQNPLGPVGDRIYRTGDLGRRRPDGDFECLGRIDDQVKIRGFRVELGEIETILRAVPGVREVVVVADKTSPHDPKLVAYWVGDATREAMIQAAREHLPSYLMPAAYRALDGFPLNTHGKIDRSRLPRVEAETRCIQAPERPLTATEAMMARIWRDVLRVRQVGVQEDFFTIGGTSPLALEVVAQIEQETGTELPLQAFFTHPTIEGLAAQFGNLPCHHGPVVVTLKGGPEDIPPLWCIFGIRIYRDLAHAVSEGGPILGIHVPFRYVPGKELRPTVEQIAAAYVREIRKRQPKGPYRLVGLCFGGVVAYEAAARLEDAGEQVELVAILDAVLPPGMRIDALERLRDYAQQVKQAPWRFTQRIGQRGRERLAGTLGRWQSAWRKPGQDPAIELSVVGAECDADVARFASQPQKIHGPLLVVRATAEPRPRWLRVDPDLGWYGFSPRVVAVDIPGKHLEILEPPQVGALGHAIDEILRRSPVRRRLMCVR